MTNKRGFYTKNNKQGFGLFSLKRLLQLYSNFTPEIGTDWDKSGQLIRQECYQKRPNATRKQGYQRWQKIGIEKCAQLRPLASKKQGDQSRLKATKNKASTYHYLILPNNLFMFCVGQKLL